MIDHNVMTKGCHVITFRYATKLEVLELLKRSGYVLHVMVVAGGIWTTPGLLSQARGRRPLVSKETVEKRHLKAKAFQSKVCRVMMASYTVCMGGGACMGFSFLSP